MVFEKPGSKGRASSNDLIYAGVSVISSALILLCKCLTSRPPMMGSTYDVFWKGVSTEVRRTPSDHTHVHHVRNGHGSNVFYTHFFPDFLQLVADLNISRCAFPRRQTMSFVATLFATFLFCVCYKATLVHDPEKRENEAFGPCHGQNVALEASLENTPFSLVNTKGCFRGVFPTGLV